MARPRPAVGSTHSAHVECRCAARHRPSHSSVFHLRIERRTGVLSRLIFYGRPEGEARPHEPVSAPCSKSIHPPSGVRPRFVFIAQESQITIPQKTTTRNIQCSAIRICISTHRKRPSRQESATRATAPMSAVDRSARSTTDHRLRPPAFPEDRLMPSETNKGRLS